MKYEKPQIWNDDFTIAGVVHESNGPIYDKCRLFVMGKRGLAIIQQRYDSTTKHTWWDVPDGDISDAIYFNPSFPEFFVQNAKEAVCGEYPFVTVRQAMRALHIPSLQKEPWETRF